MSILNSRRMRLLSTAGQLVLAAGFAALFLSQLDLTYFFVTHDHDGAWSWSPAFRVAITLALGLTALPVGWWAYSTFGPNRDERKLKSADAYGLLALGIIGSLATHACVAVVGIF